MDALYGIAELFSPFVTPLVILACAIALAVRARRRARTGGRGLPNAGSCALLAVLTGATALFAWSIGVLSGFYILDPDEMCAAAGVAGDHVVTHAVPPVGVQCVTASGRGSELVPGWVNPVLFTAAALCLAATAAAITRYLREHAAPDADPEPES